MGSETGFFFIIIIIKYTLIIQLSTINLILTIVNFCD